MIPDRSKRLYKLYDIRVYPTGVLYCDAKTKPLWNQRRLWDRVRMIGMRFGALLAAENFRVPGFHSLYLVPTTGRGYFDTRFEPEFTWWHREIRTHVKLTEWLSAARSPGSTATAALAIDWIESAILNVARRFSRDLRPVRTVAKQLREKNEHALVPLHKVKNRNGCATAHLFIADDYKKSALVLRLERSSEKGVTRELRVRLSHAEDAFLLCKGIGLDNSWVTLKRTNSIATQVAGRGFPRRIRLSKFQMSKKR